MGFELRRKKALQHATKDAILMIQDIQMNLEKDECVRQNQQAAE